MSTSNIRRGLTGHDAAVPVVNSCSSVSAVTLPLFDAIPYKSFANFENFSEAGYLLANPDVAQAVREGRVTSGQQHFLSNGHLEGRNLYNADAIISAKRNKSETIRRLLYQPDLASTLVDGTLDCMSDEWRLAAGVVGTDAVSSNDYDPMVLEYIKSNPDKIILDNGAGLRSVYYHNVINFEIAKYITTDVIGVGESLPFKDGVFDFVHSCAVLEHVRDPFRCASEIMRVLKPGGEIFVAVPFLQPYHGYPHHYYNMTKDGLRNLFPADIEVVEHYVPHYFRPVWVAKWFFQVWAAGLTEATRKDFLKMSVADLLNAEVGDYDKPFICELGEWFNTTLASGTVLRARKPH